ncbi:MAG: hypothetical protein JWM27_1624 [Gemmatimonadetes bacterium]|nr:hypothetical protein [Gemmatimonadota bacterium]
MPATDFDRLPDDARAWVFAASRPLADAEAAALLGRVDEFLARWAAHGHPVVGARDLRHGRFLLVAADERATGVSGCSIDSLFDQLRALQDELDVALLDPGPVWFRDAGGEIRGLPRPEFRALARDGGVTADTIVFDNTVGTVGDVRHGRWETALRNAWHAKAFPIPQPAHG